MIISNGIVWCYREQGSGLLLACLAVKVRSDYVNDDRTDRIGKCMTGRVGERKAA